eukprot:ctg_1019.g508
MRSSSAACRVRIASRLRAVSVSDAVAEVMLETVASSGLPVDSLPIESTSFPPPRTAGAPPGSPPVRGSAACGATADTDRTPPGRLPGHGGCSARRTGRSSAKPTRTTDTRPARRLAAGGKWPPASPRRTLAPRSR